MQGLAALLFSQLAHEVFIRHHFGQMREGLQVFVGGFFRDNEREKYVDRLRIWGIVIDAFFQCDECRTGGVYFRQAAMRDGDPFSESCGAEALPG